MKKEIRSEEAEEFLLPRPHRNLTAWFNLLPSPLSFLRKETLTEGLIFVKRLQKTCFSEKFLFVFTMKENAHQHLLFHEITTYEFWIRKYLTVLSSSTNSLNFPPLFFFPLRSIYPFIQNEAVEILFLQTYSGWNIEPEKCLAEFQITGSLMSTFGCVKQCSETLQLVNEV